VLDDGWSAHRRLSSHSAHSDSENTSKDSESNRELSSNIMGYARSAIFLFEIMLGSDNQLECLRESTHPVTSSAFMDLYLVGAVLLGTNMLIALMAKTFDIFYEQQTTNFMYLTSLLNASWANAKVVPPPFAMFALPYHLCEAIRMLRQSNWTRCYKHVGEHTCGNDDKEQAGMMAMPKVPELKEYLDNYLKESAGELGEDTKWRMQMAKQMALMAKEQSQLLNQIEHLAKQQRRYEQKVTETLAALLGGMPKQDDQMSH